MAKPKSSSAKDRAKEVPWALLLQFAVVINRRWRKLSSKERERFSGLVRASGGRPSNLNTKERRELRKLVSRLDLKRLARELLLLTRVNSRRRRRKRGHRSH